MQELEQELEVVTRRVAAAFQAAWLTFMNDRYIGLLTANENTAIEVQERQGHTFYRLLPRYGEAEHSLEVREDGELGNPFLRSAALAALMARALFKLGIPIHPLEVEFGSLLSAHDKLACREEMPREFWPVQWLKECENAG